MFKPKFMHGFKIIGTVFLLDEAKCDLKICSGKLKVKVTLEDQMIKWL